MALNDIDPVPVNMESLALKGTNKEKLDFANLSVPDMLNETQPDGHETKYLKDYHYDGDAEKSHATDSFQSIDRIITQS